MDDQPDHRATVPRQESAAERDVRLQAQADAQWVTVPRGRLLADHWGLALAVGVGTFALGLVLALWPGATVGVLAFIVAFQLIVSGSTRMLVGLASATLKGWVRVAVELAGVASVVAGVMLLLRPLQTLEGVAVVLGLGLLLVGAVDVATARFRAQGAASQLWEVVRGVLCLALGAVVLTNRHRGLGLSIVVVCVWLLAHGVTTSLSALSLRRERVTG